MHEEVGSVQITSIMRVVVDTKDNLCLISDYSCKQGMSCQQLKFTSLNVNI